jgi:uncharacterized protein with PQ loop repeat
MLQVIKWEFVKQYHRLKWLLLFFAAVLLFMALLPASWFDTENDGTNGILLFFSLILSFGLLVLSLYPMYNMISDFTRKTYTMERITGRSHIPVFLAKIFANIVVFCLANVIVFTGTRLMDKFSTESVHYFTMSLSDPYWTIALEMILLYPAILLFCYMSASTNHFFQNNRKFMTFIFLVFAGFIGSALHPTGPVYYVVGSVIGLILIIASGRMADRRFEQHVYHY